MLSSKKKNKNILLKYFQKLLKRFIKEINCSFIHMCLYVKENNR